MKQWEEAGCIGPQPELDIDMATDFTDCDPNWTPCQSSRDGRPVGQGSHMLGFVALTPQHHKMYAPHATAVNFKVTLRVSIFRTHARIYRDCVV
jgi:hypothetical protein